jgi:ABC-type nitrate/sulfonate/bicarbonate transport system permease component
MKRVNRVFCILPVGVLFVLWEGFSRMAIIPSEILPPLTTSLQESLKLVASSEFSKHLFASAYRWAMGFSLSLILSVPIGIAMAKSKRVYHFLDPLLTLTYPVPKVALVPILMLWLGAGDLSKVVVIVIGCCIPLKLSHLERQGYGVVKGHPFPDHSSCLPSCALFRIPMYLAIP